MSALDDHWLYRLARSQSRSGFLRTVIAAAAAITLPGALRTSAARAAGDPHACQKGCLWMTQNVSSHAQQRCDAKLPGLAASGVKWFLLGGLLGPGAIAAADVQMLRVIGNAVSCRDNTLFEQAQQQKRCLLPDCPGFDPTAQDGPCELAARAGLKCCPEQRVDSGYQPCSECCSPTGNGCGAGVTECGGGNP